jgi:small subunit ribosomal protein S20
LTARLLQWITMASTSRVAGIPLDIDLKINRSAISPRGSCAKLTSRTRPRYKSRLSVTANCMANHKSAEKRIRQTAKRTAINRARVSRVRTFVKKVETAIATGDKATAESALRLAQPELHRAITKGVLHKNTVSRKLSRLAARVNAL